MELLAEEGGYEPGLHLGYSRGKRKAAVQQALGAPSPDDKHNTIKRAAAPLVPHNNKIKVPFKIAIAAESAFKTCKPHGSLPNLSPRVFCFYTLEPDLDEICTMLVFNITAV